MKAKKIIKGILVNNLDNLNCGLITIETETTENLSREQTIRSAFRHWFGDCTILMFPELDCEYFYYCTSADNESSLGPCDALAYFADKENPQIMYLYRIED